MRYFGGVGSDFGHCAATNDYYFGYFSFLHPIPHQLNHCRSTASDAAIIFDVVINLATHVLQTRRVLYIGLMVVAFTAKVIFSISAMTIILICLGIGIAEMLLKLKQQTKAEGESA